MKYIKKVIHIFLSFLLILSTVIVHPVEAWATLPNVPGGGGTTYVPLPLVSLYETLRDTYHDGGTPFDFIKEAIKNSGFLSPEIPALKDLSSLDQYIGNNEPELKGDTPVDTAKNVSQFLVNNTQIVSDNSVKINSNVKNFNNNLINNYVNDHSPVYGYTFDLQQSTNIDSGFKVKLAGIINDNTNCVVLAYRGNGEQYNEVFVYDNVGLYGLRVNAAGNSVLIRMYMSYYENEIVVVKPFTASADNFKAYYYNGTDLVEEDITGEVNYVGYLSVLKDQYTTSGNFNNSPVYFAKSLTGIPVFNTFADMESYINTVGVGLSPYYYNNSVWEHFSSSTGDYTFSPTNINTVTYGDTVSYINDYHDTNNNYPDNSTVNNWINNTNEENITNNGGGSGGDDSGGGSGSGSDGIFDFLSDLGEVLGNLIKNLGQAITNIIKGISDLVTSIVTDLPTVFFDFIGAIFGWLPEEWVTLLSLSLAAMLIWGIVKVIRG